MTDPRVRALTKDIARDVSATLCHDETVEANTKKKPMHKVTDAEMLAVFIMSALTRLEGECDEMGEGDEQRDELMRAVIKCKKTMARFEPGDVVEINEKVEEEGLDLGQYRNSKVFEGRDERATKFARLMGGAKKATSHGHGGGHSDPTKSPRLHATYAPSLKQELLREQQLEKQYENAVAKKGKKGLGM
jgi:hypothetical protein